MASTNNCDLKRKQKDTIINNLKGQFGNVLHIDIIRSVASECNFDVTRTSHILLEMIGDIEQPKQKEKPKVKNQSSKNSSPTKVPPQQLKSRKCLEIDRVIENIRQGYKVLVILRGLPGSGKSRLAIAITDICLGPGNNSNHILSTDDFFIRQRGYCFDPSKLHEAHEWNHRRAFHVMSQGLSPVVIDNTNIQMWEMKPYAMMATDYGYIIEILEPDTWWVFNEKELAKRNVHGVPRAKIKDMLERYERNVTTQKLLCAYNLSYKFQKPPQLRLMPPILYNAYPDSALQHVQSLNGFPECVTKSRNASVLDQQDIVENGIESINLMDFTDVSGQEETDHQTDAHNTWEVNPVDQILMCTEENTVTVLQPNQVFHEPSISPSKPNLFPDIENAWGVDQKALQSWDIVTPIKSDFTASATDTDDLNEEIKPETIDNSSSIDVGDYVTDESKLPFGFRLITVRSRDINAGSSLKHLPPPKKIMIDQSSVTDDLEDIVDDEQERIKDLMDLFPKLSKSSLLEVYNKCHKDFHWTIDLLLEDNNLEVTEEKLQQEREENSEELVGADISSIPMEEECKKSKEPKVFKRKTISEDCLELKKVMEGRIDINKDHYSEQVYKVKQTRFGSFAEEPQPSTSATNVELDLDLESYDADANDDDDDDDDDPKNMVEINLGETFVNQLETMFGGEDGAFPKGFQPVVQMPITLARQIYSFYVESICQQMETQHNILERLVKEDEEFARKIQSQEEAHLAASRPPVFTEIVDEQIALNLHKRDVDEWKTMTADNLAAKLTRQKLFDNFPNVDKDCLLELWHAYDYDYNKTVEDLMASVGRECMNGSAESIKEPPLSAITYKEMKEAEENCGEYEELEERQPATYYREEANNHLSKRKELYDKAKSYQHRGMTDVALFYSELAKKETLFYDKANHLAAAAFIEEHAKRLQKFDTLDLHYFYVKEAIPNLDIFIDRNINLLKGGVKIGLDLFIITGRGKHSEGGRCKIKPAVMARLKKRKIGFVQLNPGLLKIRVLRDSPMTSDLPS